MFADYKPMLVEGREWWYVEVNSHSLSNWPIKLANTIIVNGHTYWDMDWFALREEIETQSVFIIYRTMDESFSGNEMLLLKFNCLSGDVFPVFCVTNYGVVELECSVQKTEIVDGRKHITVSLELKEPFDCESLTDEFDREDCNYLMAHFGVINEEWIEEVGNPMMAGVDARYRYSNPGRGVFTPLVCERDGDSILYDKVISGYSCDDIITALDEVPADELLTISGNVLTVKGTAEGAMAAVFSADGRQVMSFSGSTADISALPSGLYILRATTPDGKIITAKFEK